MTDADGTWTDESEWEIVESDTGEEGDGLGRREAVVQDIPGVTRDRVSYDANWAGRRFFIQDTGGWEPDAKGLQQLVAEQASRHRWRCALPTRSSSSSMRSWAQRRAMRRRRGF
jgi:GTP-binding protein